MNSSDKSKLIIEEANEIVENYIKRKCRFSTGKLKKNMGIQKTVLLSILTISIAVILFCIIKFI